MVHYNTVIHLGSDGFPTIIQSVHRKGGQSPLLLSPVEFGQVRESHQP